MPKTYRNTRTWKGSPDGRFAITFKEGETVTDKELGENLTATALRERFIEDHPEEAEKAAAEKKGKAEAKNGEKAAKAAPENKDAGAAPENKSE